MNTPIFLSGQMLLSMPGIGDPRFDRSVIAICLHDADGALGLVVNNPLETLTVRALMEQLDLDPGETPEEAGVLQGGPVEPGRGFVLHSAEYMGQGTISVTGPTGALWGLTSTLDVLKDIADGKGPQQWVSTLGYTGWGPGQLDDELTRHGWLAVPGDTSLIFETPVAERWETAFAKAGVAVERLSSAAGQA